MGTNVVAWPAANIRARGRGTVWVSGPSRQLELNHSRRTRAWMSPGRLFSGLKRYVHLQRPCVHTRTRNKPISMVHSAGHRRTKAAFIRANWREDARNPRAGRFPRIILAIWGTLSRNYTQEPPLLYACLYVCTSATSWSGRKNHGLQITQKQTG